MKILLVQTSFLGDTVLSTPVIAGLRHLYPDAELWMLVAPGAVQLVERDPLLAGVLAFDKRGFDRGLGGLLRTARRLREQRFDSAYALQRSARTAVLLTLARIPQRIGFRNAAASFLYHERRHRDRAQHEVLRNLALLGGSAEASEFDSRLRLFAPEFKGLSAPLRAIVSEGGPFVVLVPGSVWATKRWSADEYRSLAEELLRRGCRVLLLGAPAEKEVAGQVAEGLAVVNLAGKTTVAELMYLISAAELVVCNDSLALHLASGFETPNVAVFCATSPTFGFGPWQNQAVVVEHKNLDCRPCRRHGGRRCPTGTEACMRGVAAAEVLQAAENLVALGK